MRRSPGRLSLPVLLLFLTTGCSFVFAKGPPDGHREVEYFQCTESRVAPILDVVGVGFSIAGAATAEDDPTTGLFDEDRDPLPLSRGTKIAMNVAVGAVFAVSSFVGFERVSACRAAIEELRQRSVARPPQPIPDARLSVLRPPGR
jgi:hypothetical protein